MARILIADDEAILTMYLEEILSMNDHDVVGSASSGQEAIDLARDAVSGHHHHGHLHARRTGWH